MITKVYRSHSIVAVNLDIAGRKLHIKFDSDSNGHGYLMVTDEAIIKALDDKIANSSPNYHLAEVIDTDAEEPQGNRELESQQEEAIIKVEMTSMADAKEYLCDHFSDVTRSSLKTKKAICEAAAAHNIEFTGLQ